MRDGHPATRCVTGRELWGSEAPPPGLTGGVKTVAERNRERKGLAVSPENPRKPSPRSMPEHAGTCRIYPGIWMNQEKI